MHTKIRNELLVPSKHQHNLWKYLPYNSTISTRKLQRWPSSSSFLYHYGSKYQHNIAWTTDNAPSPEGVTSVTVCSLPIAYGTPSWAKIEPTGFYNREHY